MAPLLMLAVAWVIRRSLAPVQRMRRQVASRTADDLSPLETRGLPDEVRPLVQELNLLFDRVQRAFEAQKSFVADAAHELRSPLTALKLQLHLLRQAQPGPQREASLEDLAHGIERASRLVEQLLLLARNEPDAPAQSMQALDLDELVRREIASLAPMARLKRTDVELLSSGPLEIQGHAPSLASLVRNLVENAIQHSPAAARVQVQLNRAEDANGSMAPTLVVEDSGPGIPAHERERAFDRFYRRAGTDVPGSGLGLAIVRAVAQRHQAQLGLDASALGGLRVTVRFGVPAAAQSASGPGRKAI
jgi:two-component system OmpR family sensor kinase